jgi:hypothetical protein
MMEFIVDVVARPCTLNVVVDRPPGVDAVARPPGVDAVARPPGVDVVVVVVTRIRPRVARNDVVVIVFIGDHDCRVQ